MRGKMALYGYLYGVNKPKTQTYTLKVNSTHGTILVNPEKTIYNCGDTVTITLMPDQNYTFKNWSGVVTGSANPVTVAMYSNKVISADFNIPVGVEQHEKSTMDIFPNPASNYFNVSNAGVAGETNLFISDMNGRLMLQKTISSINNQVNISGIKQGVYYVSIISPNKNIVLKLVVIRN